MESTKEPARALFLGKMSLLGAALLAGIFFLDLLLPLGVAGGVPYVAPVLLGLFRPGRRYVVATALAGSALTALGAFLSPPGAAVWVVLTNRTLALFGIWMAAAVVLRYKGVEQALRQEQTRESLMQNLDDTIFLALNEQGRVTLINQAGCQVLGCQEADIQGLDWFEGFIPKDRREEMRRVFDLMLAGRFEGSEFYENPIVTAGGEERLLAWHTSPIRDAAGKTIGTLSAGQDITAQRQTESDLKASLRELSDLKFALDEAAIVARTNARGIIDYVNDKFCEISKYSRQELLGQDHRIINSGHHSKEFIGDLWATILAGRVWRGEIRNRAKDGGHYWVDTTIVPFLAADGRPYQFLAIRSDITARKLAEHRLREQETLAQLGEMAAVVAHEVKNPLAGISGALQVISRRMAEGAAERQVIADILARIDALNRTIQDLLLYARPRDLRRGPLVLRPLLEATARLVEQDVRFTGIEVEVEGPGGNCAGDAESLSEVFLNLIINAAQAMGGKGRVRVALAPRDGGWEVCVADKGPGIPAEQRERVFEPFYTTKSHGTGLGLSLSKRVLEALGGSIAIECPPGGGTKVRLWLPETAPPG